MNAQIPQYNHCKDPDRRQLELGAPEGVPERRIRAERRCIYVSEIQFAQWAEAESKYYFEHPSIRHVSHRRWSDRRVIDLGPPRNSGGERRTQPERRALRMAEVSFAEWADEKSNYYYHYHI